MMARKRNKNITENHIRILQVMEDFHEQYGYPPSIREIGDQAKISSTSVVNYYLDQMQAVGLIERDSKVSRGIRQLVSVREVMENPIAMAAASLQRKAQTVREMVGDMLRVPIMGKIIAGSPMPVPQSDFDLYDAESAVEVAASMLPARERRDQLFALEVKGDSMIDAMVNEGDIVIMKRASSANNGEMVAVWLNEREETTLKYFYQEGKRIRLQPANPTMNPIFIDPPETVEIQGKVVMVIRQMRGLPS